MRRDAGPTAVARPVNKAPERGTVIATLACNDGGARERVPPASDSGATSRRVGINFAFVISSQCCARRYTACACSLSQFFTEDDMAKKAKKAKKSAKATKKVAKKTSRKK